MARLAREDGTTLDDLEAIAAELRPLGVALAHWPPAEAVSELLRRDGLDAEEKEQVLAAHDHYFQKLRSEAGYQARDLIVLHPEIPGLDEILAKFATAHTHDDDEVRYIIAGEGIFGFVRPDGSQIALTVQGGEYLNVPRDTEHWFVMTEKRQIKAVRYFTNTAGWVPRYTGTDRRV